MGRSKEIKSSLKASREREFVIDPETGLISEENPEPESATRPAAAPVQAAHQTYD